jgi:hypothetical protein
MKDISITYYYTFNGLHVHSVKNLQFTEMLVAFQ